MPTRGGGGAAAVAACLSTLILHRNELLQHWQTLINPGPTTVFIQRAIGARAHKCLPVIPHTGDTTQDADAAAAQQRWSRAAAAISQIILPKYF
jgi:hypothetical protein